MKQYTLEEMRERQYWSFANGDWAWEDDYCGHLMREINGEWVELTKGMKCTYVWSFANGDWRWTDTDDEDHWHLMREINGEWVELTEGMKCKEVWSDTNGGWGWKDDDGGKHEVKIEAKNSWKKYPDEMLRRDEYGNVRIAHDLISVMIEMQKPHKDRMHLMAPPIVATLKQDEFALKRTLTLLKSLLAMGEKEA